MTANTDILIAGGYGTVGRKIAANLAQDYPNQVVIAGRNVETASRVASELGYGVRAGHIDVRDRDSVDKATYGIGTVVSCVAQPETPHLLLASYYPVTLGARTAFSRLALLPQWVPGLLSVLLPLTRSALAKRRSGTSGRLGAAMNWLKRKYNDLDWWGVQVEVRGAGGVQKASVQGHGQASATALSAAAFVRALVEGEVHRPGIWTADQVVPAGPFLARLAAHGLVPTISSQGRR